MSLASDSPDHFMTGGATKTAQDPVPAVLDTASRAALGYLAGIPARGVSPHPDALAAIGDFDIELPDGPRNPADVVMQLHRLGSPATTASAGGRFFGPLSAPRCRPRSVRGCSPQHGTRWCSTI